MGWPVEMFRAHSPYSPFFTSGLLFEPVSARPTTDSAADKQSIPSTIYFDVEFSDDDQYRSFLSLDLAETQSTRSLSLKRKASSKRTGRSSARSRPKFSPIAESPSRESLRSGPSPKPVPSIKLPPAPSRSLQPTISTAPPRLPSLPALPSLELDLSASPKRRKKSITSAQKPVTVSPPPSVRPPTRQGSTVSTRTRLRNRATALALLEGRQKPVVAPVKREPKNFMSMSDDEDEDDEDVLPRSDSEDEPVQVQAYNPSFEPEDIVLPASPTTLSFPPSRVLRPSNSANLGGRKASQRRAKHKSGKTGEWFPLKSFIDLCNENDDESGSGSWNWRSFIEVSTLS
ncbi:hypothetical protein NP233_g3133 [Leucocoprinus birnbaumii]|uniref:Uncharacterized protein n=1 Tax=Leucocoprinus birnbaumii TaxID=56174 RepID=A0AAD5VX36_9AGAR|nr:hypothetical protein NP233_g3133 [Leucocoprinus birnbaumii]